LEVAKKVGQADLYIFNLLAFLKDLEVKAVIKYIKVIKKLDIKKKLEVKDFL
jgi:hypothetical protein